MIEQTIIDKNYDREVRRKFSAHNQSPIFREIEYGEKLPLRCKVFDRHTLREGSYLGWNEQTGKIKIATDNLTREENHCWWLIMIA